MDAILAALEPAGMASPFRRRFMPELPDLEIYVEALQARVLRQIVSAAKVLHPFVLRTYEPPLASVVGREVIGVRRLGKRIVLECSDEHFLIVHLMLLGRLQWLEPRKKVPARAALLALEYATGTLVLTEQGSKRRASVHYVHGTAALESFRRAGLDPLESDLTSFVERLREENRTLKRALTDQDLVSGVGNAYSDEILHRARLSPTMRTGSLDDEGFHRLYHACKTTLTEWTSRLREEAKGSFPSRVTAFHPEMAVHGRYGKPCPVCQTPVQRVKYADSESNYCPTCQTGGKLLADRGLSRLLGADWPRTLEELEERRRNQPPPKDATR
ncbi:MAG: DNA-formamidopyrimidine glycosylase family protein [Polyangiaceae bacterium]